MAYQDPALGLARGEVRLAPYDSRWPRAFRDEVTRLSGFVVAACLEPPVFEHIGSTSVQGLSAKPILDLLVGYPTDADYQLYVAVLMHAGYEPRGPQGNPGRELLVLGPVSARTHHLNLVLVDGRVWCEGLAFRDALRSSPVLASEYHALKQDLATRYAGNRKAYTEAKEHFILTTLKAAGLPEREANRALQSDRTPSDR